MNANNKSFSNVNQENELSDEDMPYTLLTQPLIELTVAELDLDRYLEQYAQLPSPSRELFYANEVYLEMCERAGPGSIFNEPAGFYFPEAIAGVLLIGMKQTALVLGAMALTLGEQYPRDQSERNDALEDYMFDNSLRFERLANWAYDLFTIENGGFKVSANRYAKAWLNNKTYMKRLSQRVEKSRMARPLYIHMLYASAGSIFVNHNTKQCFLFKDAEIKKYLAKVPSPLKPVFLCTVSLCKLRERQFAFLTADIANYAHDTVIAFKQLGLNNMASLFETMIQTIPQPYSRDSSRRFEQLQVLGQEALSILLLCEVAINKMMPQFEQVANELSVKVFNDNPQHYPGVEARFANKLKKV